MAPLMLIFRDGGSNHDKWLQGRCRNFSLPRQGLDDAHALADNDYAHADNDEITDMKVDELDDECKFTQQVVKINIFLKANNKILSRMRCST